MLRTQPLTQILTIDLIRHSQGVIDSGERLSGTGNFLLKASKRLREGNQADPSRERVFLKVNKIIKPFIQNKENLMTMFIGIILFFAWPLAIGATGSLYAWMFWIPLWPIFKLFGKGEVWSRWHMNTHKAIWYLPKVFFGAFGKDQRKR